MIADAVAASDSDEVRDVLDGWPEYAREVEVPQETVEAIGSALADRAREVGRP